MPSTKKVLSFALYGAHSKYLAGALANVRHARRVYGPAWLCRFYVDADTVPWLSIDLLRKTGAEIVLMNSSSTLPLGGATAGMFWRFLVAADPTVSVYLIRDVDSRPTLRERAAVDEWLASSYAFHLMRDHPIHSLYRINGGMWGGRVLLPEIRHQIEAWPSRAHQWDDMNFLEVHVWPRMQPDSNSSRVLQHDAFSCDKYGSHARPFPTARSSALEHVGQVWDGDSDTPLTRDCPALVQANLWRPRECKSPSE